MNENRMQQDTNGRKPKLTGIDDGWVSIEWLGKTYRFNQKNALLRPKVGGMRGGHLRNVVADARAGVRLQWRDRPRDWFTLEDLVEGFDLREFEEARTPRAERAQVTDREFDQAVIGDLNDLGLASVVVRTDEVMGWPLAIVNGENRPRVSHRVLAERLGYSDPKSVLDLATSALGQGWTSRAARSESPSGGGRPRIDWLFDRRQVLEVTMLARTANAAAVRGQVLDVFEAWLDGQKPPAAPALTDPWAAIQAIAGGAMELRREVRRDIEQVRTEASERVERVQTTAESARETAEAAFGLASSLESRTIASAPPKKDGWKFVREIAIDLGLPIAGPGAKMLNACADAIRATERGLSAVAFTATDGGINAITFAPQVQKELAPFAAEILSFFDRSGYYVLNGRMLPKRGDVVAKRLSEATVVAKALQWAIRIILGGDHQSK